MDGETALEFVRSRHAQGAKELILQEVKDRKK